MRMSSLTARPQCPVAEAGGGCFLDLCSCALLRNFLKFNSLTWVDRLESFLCYPLPFQWPPLDNLMLLLSRRWTPSCGGTVRLSVLCESLLALAFGSRRSKQRF